MPNANWPTVTIRWILVNQWCFLMEIFRHRPSWRSTNWSPTRRIVSACGPPTNSDPATTRSGSPPPGYLPGFFFFLPGLMIGSACSRTKAVAAAAAAAAAEGGVGLLSELRRGVEAARPWMAAAGVVAAAAASVGAALLVYAAHQRRRRSARRQFFFVLLRSLRVVGARSMLLLLFQDGAPVVRPASTWNWWPTSSPTRRATPAAPTPPCATPTAALGCGPSTSEPPPVEFQNLVSAFATKNDLKETKPAGPFFGSKWLVPSLLGFT